MTAGHCTKTNADSFRCEGDCLPHSQTRHAIETIFASEDGLDTLARQPAVLLCQYSRLPAFPEPSRPVYYFFPPYSSLSTERSAQTNRYASETAIVPCSTASIRRNALEGGIAPFSITSRRDVMN